MTVTNVVNRRFRRTLPALLDTGADITAIPQSLLTILKLYPIAQLQLEEIDGESTTVLMYAVRLTLGELVIPRQKIILTGLDFAVVGRDVLNLLTLHLYGPQLSFEIKP
ncbi:MAG: aspartyl protease family protein [Chloroflexota bacterium]|nr:aspartyl protease family protein [Chloroflexota bacterium]